MKRQNEIALNVLIHVAIKRVCQGVPVNFVHINHLTHALTGWEAGAKPWKTGR